MRIIMMNILLALTIPCHASKETQDFRITSINTDTSIHADSARIVFRIVDSQGAVLLPIRVGANDTEERLKPDANGTVTMTIKAEPSVFFLYRDGYEEVITDTIHISSQSVIYAIVTLNYRKPRPGPIQVRKPVIYIYAPEETEVNIKVNQQGKMLFTYPLLSENGWDFRTQSDGRLLLNNKLYNYLFWESEINSAAVKFDMNKGFVVATDTLLSFLESSLSQMGFLPTEAADFITYWYPAMIKNPINRIHFLFDDACNQYATLDISPSPSNVFRVGMWWGSVKSDLELRPQQLLTIHRQGLTVLEWGGAEMSEDFTVIGL